MDLDSMKLPELKALAKELGIRGYSTMRKPELRAEVSAFYEDEREALFAETEAYADSLSEPVSYVESIKAAIVAADEARSNRGRHAGLNAKVTGKLLPESKARNYRLQRGSESAKLTARQARRIRKTENRKRGHNVCSGFSS